MFSSINGGVKKKLRGEISIPNKESSHRVEASIAGKTTPPHRRKNGKKKGVFEKDREEKSWRLLRSRGQRTRI